MDNYFYKEEHITTRILQNSKEIRVKLQKLVHGDMMLKLHDIGEDD